MQYKCCNKWKHVTHIKSRKAHIKLVKHQYRTWASKVHNSTGVTQYCWLAQAPPQCLRAAQWILTGQTWKDAQQPLVLPWPQPFPYLSALDTPYFLQRQILQESNHYCSNNQKNFLHTVIWLSAFHFSPHPFASVFLSQWLGFSSCPPGYLGQTQHFPLHQSNRKLPPN